MKLKSPYIDYVILRSCEIKAKIVALDEKEQDLRAILNFGHTFAHAFENIINYDDKKLIHGEAVGIGMCCALKLSVLLNICSEKEATNAIQLISKFKLPTSLNFIKTDHLTPENLLTKFYLDKKVNDGKIIFVLLMMKPN